MADQDPPARLVVLHVSQPTSDGVGRYLIDVLHDQTARGWTTVVATPADATLEARCQAFGARHYRWEARRRPGTSIARETRALSRIAREVCPDVVHLHSSKAGLAGRLAIRDRRPTMFSPHAWSFLHGSRLIRRLALSWERLAARWTSMVVCVSDAEQSRGKRAGISCPSTVVRNAVDLRWFTPASDHARAAARQGLGLGPEPLAVCIGRLTRQKGQTDLVAAWPVVRRHVPEARLLFVGDGPLRRALEERTGPGVAMLGHVNDVRQGYAAADGVVLPSRWEGLSFVLLEALASGCSIVATDVDGAREAIGEGDASAGVVVQPENPDALARALAERLGDPALARAEGGRARCRAQRFGLDGWGDHLARVTRDVAGFV